MCARKRHVENFKTAEEMRYENEEKLCKSIVKSIARRNREKHAILAEVEEEEQDVICIDDVTGEELPWHAVRKAREQGLKHLRDLGVYEKVHEREAIAQYQVTPVDTKWVDTDKAIEGEHAHQVTICGTRIQTWRSARSVRRDYSIEALRATISIVANHKETFPIMHIDVARAYFYVKAQGPVLVRLPVEDRMGADAGKIGLRNKSMYGTRDAASNWERDWQEYVKSWGFQLGFSSKNLYHRKGIKVQDWHAVMTSCSQDRQNNSMWEQGNGGCIQSKQKSSAAGHQGALKALNWHTWPNLWPEKNRALMLLEFLSATRRPRVLIWKCVTQYCELRDSGPWSRQFPGHHPLFQLSSIRLSSDHPRVRRLTTIQFHSWFNVTTIIFLTSGPEIVSGFTAIRQRVQWSRPVRLSSKNIVVLLASCRVDRNWGASSDTLISGRQFDGSICDRKHEMFTIFRRYNVFALSLRAWMSDASNVYTSMSATMMSPFDMHPAYNTNPKKILGKTFLPNWWSLFGRTRMILNHQSDRNFWPTEWLSKTPFMRCFPVR